MFASMDNAYMQARSADVQDIGQAMLNILQGKDTQLQGSEPCILAADDLTPSETVRLDKKLLLGFVTRGGSTNSHTAILARSMNIPALIQCSDVKENWDGKLAVIDGYRLLCIPCSRAGFAGKAAAAPAGGSEKTGASAGTQG